MSEYEGKLQFMAGVWDLVTQELEARDPYVAARVKDIEEEMILKPMRNELRLEFDWPDTLNL